jgi:hypothetical protein
MCAEIIMLDEIASCLDAGARSPGEGRVAHLSAGERPARRPAPARWIEMRDEGAVAWPQGQQTGARAKWSTAASVSTLAGRSDGEEWSGAGGVFD